MPTENSDLRTWQRRNLAVLDRLVRDLDFPIMMWTVGPLGIVGEPYGVRTDTERRTAVETWANAIDATWWAPHENDGMTALRASNKDYEGVSIMLRTTLYGDEPDGESADHE